MKEQSKRNRQQIRESIHLPFYERISRSGSTANSDVDPNEVLDRFAVAPPTKHRLGNVNRLSLSEEIIKKCQKAFVRFDINGDGVIDLQELTNALVSMGYVCTEDDAADIMDDVDQNGSDSLDFLEFLRVIQRQKDKTIELTEEQKMEINIREAWNALKNEKTDYMDVSKFKHTLQSFDLNIDVDALATALDVDGSGRVDFEEFHGLFANSSLES